MSVARGRVAGGPGDDLGQLLDDPELLVAVEDARGVRTCTRT